MHKFNIKSMAKLDTPERRQLLPADKILASFGLGPGDIVADIGCGIGYFSLPAAALVGPAGKVLAMDIAGEMLAEVRTRAREYGRENIETIKINEHDFLVPDNSATVGLAFFVLHETQDPRQFLAEAKRIIKPGGKLALLDWEKRSTPNGPPVEHRQAREEAINLLQRTGFDVKRRNLGEDFYSLLGFNSDR